jgi:hypothetical protein
MKKVEKKIENFLSSYVNNLEDRPVKTIIKTLIVIWIATKVIKMLRK